MSSFIIFTFFNRERSVSGDIFNQIDKNQTASEKLRLMLIHFFKKKSR